MGERLKLNEVSGNVVSFDTNLERKLESLKINIEPIQEGSGDPSPENVRPISGWTGVSISATGKNLFDYINVEWIDGVRDDNGNIVASTGTHYTKIPIKVKPSTTYTVSGNPLKAEGYVTRIYYLKSNYEWISRTSGSQDNSYTFITPQNCSFIQLQTTISNTDLSTVQIEEGQIQTEYEIFGNVYPITFPSEAETVYGGALNVTTGELTVDRAMVNMDTLTWQYFPKTNPPHFGATVSNIKLPIPNGNLICSCYKTVVGSPYANVNNTIRQSGEHNNKGIKLSDTRFTSQPDFVAWLNTAHPQLVYSIDAPQTYQLTPTEITTLLGANTIYADCGEIEAKWYDEDLVQPADARVLTLENCKEGPIDSFVVTCTNYYQSGTPAPTNESFLYEINDIGFTIGSFENEVPLIPDNYTPVTAAGATLNYLGDGVYFLEGTTTAMHSYDVPLKPFTIDRNKKYIWVWEVLGIEQSNSLFRTVLLDSQGNGFGGIFGDLHIGEKGISIPVFNTNSTISNDPHIRFVVMTGYKNVKFKYKLFETDPNKIFSPDISTIPKPFYSFSYNAMTGILTFSRKTKTLTADDLIEVGTSDSGVQYAITTDIPDMKINSGIDCNRYYWKNAGNNNTIDGIEQHIIIYDNRFTDLATAKELIGGTIAYYYLSTPETYQLNSYPVILQKGTNIFLGNDDYSRLSIKYREEIKESILNLRRRSFAWDYKTYIASHPAVLQKLCSTGKASNYFKIGDEIIIPWTDNSEDTPIEYQYPFVVTHFGDVYDENGNLHENGMWLMAKYATPKDIIFDAAESTTVNLAEEPNALEGWYYWGVDGYDYTELRLNTGDAIPTTHASVVKCGINEVNALRYGYNRWKDSAYRQWLNSDAAKNEGWWTEQHMGDRPPSDAQNNLPGWLNGFTEEWRAIFKPVKVDTACNTVTDGGVADTTYDTFFLPSVEQMYGEPQAAGVEGEYWPYWKEETGLDAPSNGSSSNTNDARKIPSIANPTGSAVHCRLRSAYCDNAYNVWFVNTVGYLNRTAYYGSAFNSYRALPACVIY